MNLRRISYRFLLGAFTFSLGTVAFWLFPTRTQQLLPRYRENSRTSSKTHFERDKKLPTDPGPTESPANPAIFDGISDQPNYLGCWRGMGGGSLKITREVISDRGSAEKAHYEEIRAVKGEPQGLQTGEEYLLTADMDFPKSFLARFIRLSYLSDGTVGIVTYDSYQHYLSEKISGQGLFEKVDCK